MADPYYIDAMKILNVRLPEPLFMEIEAESRARKVSKSDVVRERLQESRSGEGSADPLASIRDLIGSVDGLPADLSARKKKNLRVIIRGSKRDR